MPEDIRMVIDTVTQRNDVHGRRVMIQGIVVPQGQQVPSAGEVAYMELEDSPFAARIGMPTSAHSQDDVRRLLWDACQAVLGLDEITADAMTAMQRRIIRLRRLLLEQPDDVAQAQRRTQTLTMPEDLAATARMAREDMEAEHRRLLAEIEVDSRPPDPARMTVRTHEDVQAEIVRTLAGAGGRPYIPTFSSSSDPPDVPAGLPARWPSPDFVLGQPEGTHDRDTNGRAPRNIRLRDRDPEAEA